MKLFILFVVASLAATTAQAQQKIAVLDFKAGTGVGQGDVDGISAIFGTYFIDPAKFALVERTQIDRAIAEQGFQKSSLTQQQMVRIGQILNLTKIVIGDVNVVGGQYNVDVRIVDVQSGAVNATDGATWAKGSSYRELMSGLAGRLKTKMFSPTASISTSSTQSQVPMTASVVTLLGYLHVYPDDLGEFPSIPSTVIAQLNRQSMYGYDEWRLPTVEELAVMQANSGRLRLKSERYMTSDGARYGIVRLVTIGKTVAEQETERQKAVEEARIIASLSPFNVARLYTLKNLGQDLCCATLNYSEVSAAPPSGWSRVNNYKELSNAPQIQQMLSVSPFWWATQNVDNSNNQSISLTINGQRHDVQNWAKVSVYDPLMRMYTTKRMVFVSRKEIVDGQLPNDVVFYDECKYTCLYYRNLNVQETQIRITEIMTNAEK